MKRLICFIAILILWTYICLGQTTYYMQGLLRQPDDVTARAYLKITGGGGSGSVTNFLAGDLLPLFLSTVTTPNTFPHLSFAAVNQNANLVYSGPAAGPAAAPTFRSLTSADIPALGYVTSVGLALPASVFTVSGSPVTGAGTLTGTFATQVANTFFAGPTSGADATPAFRAIDQADLPTISTDGIWKSSASVLGRVTVGTGLSFDGTTLNATGLTNGSGSTVLPLYVSAFPGVANTHSIISSNGLITGIASYNIFAGDTFEEYGTGLLTTNAATNGFGWDGAARVLSNAGIGITNFWNGSDRFLNLTNGEYIRKFAFSNNWRDIKIGLLITAKTNGALLSTVWGVGVCSSAGNGFTGAGTSTCSNFFGWVNARDWTNGQAYSFNANAGFGDLTPGANNGQLIQIESGIKTNQVNYAGTGSGFASASPFNTNRHSIVIVRLQKSTSSAAIVAQNNATDFQKDFDAYRLGTLLSGFAGANAYATLDTGFTVGTLASVSSSVRALEDSPLDSIDIFWNNASIEIQIYAICVRALGDDVPGNL